MKKKILFVAQMKNYGGVEKSLISLLHSVPAEKYSVTVAVLGNCGRIVDEIPDWVEVKKISGYDQKQFAKELLKKGKPIKAIKIAIGYLFAKLTKRVSFGQYDASTQRFPKLDSEYDVGIAWAMPDAFENIYLLKRVLAKKKAVWIHMDIAHYRMPADTAKYLKLYDNIFCVSKSCKNSFDARFPLLSDKTRVFYNVIDKAAILSAAQTEKDFSFDNSFSIVTCGRLAKEKRPLLSIDICKALINDGFTDFKWYFIGDGPFKKVLADKATENGLEEHIILLGSKPNPFPFVKDADLYVQLSHHESFCLTLAEAQILGVAAVTTNFPAAYEIVENNITGYIVNQDSISLFNTIKSILENKAAFNELRENAKKIEHSKFSGSFSELEEILL